MWSVLNNQTNNKTRNKLSENKKIMCMIDRAALQYDCVQFMDGS